MSAENPGAPEGGPRELTFERLARMVEEPPFHRWLGIKLVSFEPGRVVLACPWREEFVSDTRIRYTHGGILGSLIDIAGDYAVVSAIGRGVPTVDMRVDYHKVAQAGEALRAEACVIRAGNTLATAETRIFAPDAALVASGRAVYLTLKR